jgi:ABC-type Fe3+-siderophore transport system permease subunit
VQLHLDSHHFTHGHLDWRAAVLAGVTAGAVFLIVGAILMALMTGASLLEPPRMVAAIILGRGALQSPQPYPIGNVLVAFVMHFSLAIVLALVLGLIMASFNFDSSMGMASLTGAAFGVAVYLINFYGMTRLFPWFAEARNWASACVHIAFGIVAANLYMRLEWNPPRWVNVDSGGPS